jgi:hypothetical protein
MRSLVNGADARQHVNPQSKCNQYARQDDTLSALGISLSLALASALIVGVIGGWCWYRKKAAR